MSDEASEATSTGPNVEAQTETEPPSVSFDEFLERVPPGQLRRIEDFRFFHSVPGGMQTAYVSPPQLLLHCKSDACGGDRVFRCVQSSRNIEVKAGVGVSDRYVYYTCSNCGESQKSFALRMIFESIDERLGKCFKFGEFPAFGPPTPTRLLRMFGTDRDIFLKGRRCENQGLGIGAFSYYRRIVENHRNQIIDEIIKVATKVAPGMVEMLERAKNENQFSKAVESVKDAIPPTLLINGHNPLTLLHSALSKGLHAQTDEQCLQFSNAIRVALAELAEHIGQALKDEAELNAAISRLMTS
jgi:hypothetical protein